MRIFLVTLAVIIFFFLNKNYNETKLFAQNLDAGCYVLKKNTNSWIPQAESYSFGDCNLLSLGNFDREYYLWVPDGNGPSLLLLSGKLVQAIAR